MAKKHSTRGPKRKARVEGCPADKRRFFNWLVGPLTKMAQDLNTTLPLMLTQAAKEGGWITKHLDHNQPLNNPFGVNKINSKGQAAGNVDYPSLDVAIQYWVQRYASRMRGAQTPDVFIRGMEHPAQGQPYNSNVGAYTAEFMRVYNSVGKYMKICGVQ